MNLPVLQTASSVTLRWTQACRTSRVHVAARSPRTACQDTLSCCSATVRPKVWTTRLPFCCTLLQLHGALCGRTGAVQQTDNTASSASERTDQDHRITAVPNRISLVAVGGRDGWWAVAARREQQLVSASPVLTNPRAPLTPSWSVVQRPRAPRQPEIRRADRGVHHCQCPGPDHPRCLGVASWQRKRVGLKNDGRS